MSVNRLPFHLLFSHFMLRIATALHCWLIYAAISERSLSDTPSQNALWVAHHSFLSNLSFCEQTVQSSQSVSPLVSAANQQPGSWVNVSLLRILLKHNGTNCTVRTQCETANGPRLHLVYLKSNWSRRMNSLAWRRCILFTKRCFHTYMCVWCMVWCWFGKVSRRRPVSVWVIMVPWGSQPIRRGEEPASSPWEAGGLAICPVCVTWGWTPGKDPWLKTLIMSHWSLALGRGDTQLYRLHSFSCVVYLLTWLWRGFQDTAV